MARKIGPKFSMPPKRDLRQLIQLIAREHNKILPPARLLKP